MGEEKNAYILAGKAKERDQFENLRVGGLDTMEICLKTLWESVLWLHLSQDLNRRQNKHGSKPSS
jgi:hypothetical protein